MLCSFTAYINKYETNFWNYCWPDAKITFQLPSEGDLSGSNQTI